MVSTEELQSIVEQLSGKKPNNKINHYEVATRITKEFDLITPEDLDEIFLYQDGIYVPGEKVIKKKLVHELKDKGTKQKIGEILESIKLQTYKTKEEMITGSIDLIAVKNGVLNINTKELTDFSPDKIFFNKLPVDYDKDAMCPQFKSFMGDVVIKSDEELLQRLVGMCLIRDARFQKAGILIGKGGEGKSTFLKTVMALLGDHNCENFRLQQLIEDKYAAIHLYGKLANISADIPYKGLSDTSLFKAIVTGDELNARTLNKPFFKFTPYSKLLFSANKIPKTYDMSDGFFDRWVIVEFTGKNFRDTGEAIDNFEYTFTKNDEEMSGILNWALDGFLKAELYGFADVSNVKSKWLKHSDSVYAFILDNLVVGKKDDFIIKEELYEMYVEYCKKQRIDVIVNDNSFHRSVLQTMKPQKYQPTVNGKQVNAWRFIKYK